MIDKRVLYTIDGPWFHQNGGHALANFVEIRDGNTLCFVDPGSGRGHMFPGKLLRETKDGFDWHWLVPPFGPLEAEDRGTVAARVVTLARYYDELVPAGVVRNPIEPRPQSDQEFWELYRRMAKG
ncbi:MAG: hypothetical protein ACM3ZC_13425 [Bacteroidota bacterium]